MKIGIVLPAVPAYSETFFRSKIEGLVGNGHKVYLVVNRLTVQSDFCGAQVISGFNTQGNVFKVSLLALATFLRLITLKFSSVWKFLKLERKEGKRGIALIQSLLINSSLLQSRLDWVHFGFGTMALGKENVAEAIGARMAVSFRGFDISIYPLKHPGCYNQLWKKVDRIHVISDDIAELVVQHGGELANSKCVKITPAIDVNFFTNHSTRVSFQQPIVLLTVARLHWKKGIDYTLEALALLQRQGISFQYTIIGEGPEEERLRFTAHQLGIADSVIFAGKQTRTFIKQQLAQTDVYLQYSIQEGFCNAVLEAQAMGVYCIVSDAEGLSENVLNGNTGTVVQKRNPKALESGLKEYCQLTELEIAKRRQRAIERVKINFIEAKQQLQFMQFYHD
jgi:colanic acid/amylovoran biosynthesis glycosyltransferase